MPIVYLPTSVGNLRGPGSPKHHRNGVTFKPRGKDPNGQTIAQNSPTDRRVSRNYQYFPSKGDLQQDTP